MSRFAPTLLWLAGFRTLREPGVVRIYVPNWITDAALAGITRNLTEDPGRWRWERHGRTLVGRAGG